MAGRTLEENVSGLVHSGSRCSFSLSQFRHVLPRPSTSLLAAPSSSPAMSKRRKLSVCPLAVLSAHTQSASPRSFNSDDKSSSWSTPSPQYPITPESPESRPSSPTQSICSMTQSLYEEYFVFSNEHGRCFSLSELYRIPADSTENARLGP